MHSLWSSWCDTRGIASRYDPEHFQASPEEQAEIAKATDAEHTATDSADYVWLPIHLTQDETGKTEIRIEWKNRWTVEAY